MAQSGSRNRGAQRQRRNGRPFDNEGIIPVLAKAVREVESAVQRGSVMPSVRTKYQVIAILAREERLRVKADTEVSESQRGEQLKRLDGIATILAKTAARDSTLFTLLDADAEISEHAVALKRQMMTAAGMAAPEESAASVDDAAVVVSERRAFPASVRARMLSRPFRLPDYSAPTPPEHNGHGLLSGWELLGPLYRAFEEASSGQSACMELPEPDAVQLGSDQPMMAHQARLVAAVEGGHRTFLLADEPGLGKTAQALLAARAAGAFPLLVVVPNVVKTSWAREAALWAPGRRATVINGDGDDMDGFADIVIINYEVLDRHAHWLGDLGFAGMVVDEAHFVKNKSSQRSQLVLALADKIRRRTARPLMMALTGTPLINDVEDFQAIWELLGWIDDKKPRPQLMHALEEKGFTPADHGFYPAARSTVIDLGIVRRRKVDVAQDIPARRVADLPVELDGEVGRSIRQAEAELAQRMVERYDVALANRAAGAGARGTIDLDLVRRVAAWEREDQEASSGENVFGMMRRLGSAKAGLAADYAVQLAGNVGKVVFFAKHVDVMDTAEEVVRRRGMKSVSIRGDQSRAAREEAIRSFTEDPDVAVIVCSLSAAGVGLNLQVASNLVLAELSWTAAEQTQAIDRIHRIGQSEPVTAWRVIAAHTIDTKIAELIDSKAGLAARALDGSDEEVGSSADVQTEALVALLTEALERRVQQPSRRTRRL
ncbi:DEAD/DEAH box helicase [Nocardioidaceae bacterium]|nr:DEAD/DEAH box helicase [Nocardioidaceae bacterium]